MLDKGADKNAEMLGTPIPRRVGVNELIDRRIPQRIIQQGCTAGQRREQGNHSSLVAVRFVLTSVHSTFAIRSRTEGINYCLNLMPVTC